MPNKYFEMAMILATLTGFIGIIFSLMFSTAFQIQGQRIEITKIIMDYPTQFNQTANETIRRYEEGEYQVATFSVVLFAAGMVLFASSLAFAFIGFLSDMENNP